MAAWTANGLTDSSWLGEKADQILSRGLALLDWRASTHERWPASAATHLPCPAAAEGEKMKPGSHSQAAPWAKKPPPSAQTGSEGTQVGAPLFGSAVAAKPVSQWQNSPWMCPWPPHSAARQSFGLFGSRA